MTNRRNHVPRANRRAALLAVAALALVSCSGSESPTATTNGPVGTDATTDGSTADGSTTPDSTVPSSGGITLVAYESFPTEGTPVNDLLDEFSAVSGIDVEILVAGDTGTMLAKAELTAGNPEGDVMWGVDNSLLSRAVDSGIFEPYTANGLASIPTEFTSLVPNAEATPVDFGDVCVNYDIGALAALGLDAPSSLEELADPAYADLLVVQNPATSSPGLAFLLATIDEYGVDGWQDYWSRLVDNGVAVIDGWTQAYYEVFSYAGGDRPLVVSYGSSPPFEVLFADTTLDTAPTGVVESTCYRQVEFAGILAGTERTAEAQALIDFMVTPEFQAALPLNLFVFPTNAEVELDQTFLDFAVIPADSRSIDSAAVTENRETWIDEWTDLVIG